MLDFETELFTLFQAPYSYIHLITHDEARATSVVMHQARRTGRQVVEWSMTRGMSWGELRVPPGDFGALLDGIEAESQPLIF